MIRRTSGRNKRGYAGEINAILAYNINQKHTFGMHHRKETFEKMNFDFKGPNIF